jgi:O-antigen/teichoic acid export membrane protein
LAKLVFLLSSILFLPLAAFATQILHYWMGADFAAKGAVVMFYCCVAFYFISLTMVPSLVALGMGKPVVNAVFASITAGINLVLVYPLTRYWGVNGAAGALLASSLPFPVYIYVVNRNIIKVDTTQYFKVVFGRMAFVGIIFFAVVNNFVTKLAVSGLLLLFLILGSYLVISCLAYFLGLDGKEREIIRDRVTDIRARLSGAA